MEVGGLALPEGSVLFLKGGEMMVFRHDRREGRGGGWSSAAFALA
jgi:hypothetical protein